MFELEVERLRTCWVVRPKGQLGTHGWVDGKAWSAYFSRAATAERALVEAKRHRFGW